jgi:hypothetical protein
MEERTARVSPHEQGDTAMAATNII